MRARILIWLYPLGWRRRYGEEMAALLQDTGVGARTAIDLLLGAARAHVRPRSSWSALVSPLERMRETIGVVALCWGGLCLAGAGFAKATEDPPFSAAATAHPLLGALRAMAGGLAVASAVVVAAAGLPLLAWVAHAAWRERRRDLARWLLLPPAALVALAVFTAALAIAGGGHVVVVALWMVVALSTATICAWAPRAVLRRVKAPAGLLRLGARAGVAVAVLMGAITLTLIAYAVALAITSPEAAALSNGPGGVTTTGEAIAVQAAVAAVATALAAVSAARGARAGGHMTTRP